MNKNPQSELGKLQRKFELTGFAGENVITDKELKDLSFELAVVAEYMQDREDLSVAACIRHEQSAVDRMIHNRKHP